MNEAVLYKDLIFCCCKYKGDRHGLISEKCLQTENESQSNFMNLFEGVTALKTKSSATKFQSEGT